MSSKALIAKMDRRFFVVITFWAIDSPLNGSMLVAFATSMDRSHGQASSFRRGELIEVSYEACQIEKNRHLWDSKGPVQRNSRPRGPRNMQLSHPTRYAQMQQDLISLGPGPMLGQDRLDGTACSGCSRQMYQLQVEI